MTEEHVERRRTAILAPDVAGTRAISLIGDGSGIDVSPCRVTLFELDSGGVKE